MEAIQWAGQPINTLPSWLILKTISWSKWPDSPTDFLKIDTLEGPRPVDHGSWIIRGIVGEVYPVRNDIFEATYERVEDE